jgi:hypothetical protein
MLTRTVKFGDGDFIWGRISGDNYQTPLQTQQKHYLATILNFRLVTILTDLSLHSNTHFSPFHSFLLIFYDFIPTNLYVAVW